MTGSPDTDRCIAGETELVDIIRQHAELSGHAYKTPGHWAYPTPFHLLLALARRFTAVPSPHDLVGMPDRLCYSNAANYALAHRGQGLVYAEGFALTHAGLDFHLPHAWCVRPDGTVLDPTWDDAPGRAYVGVPVADPLMWPVDGGGLFADFGRTLPLLRDGFPEAAIANVGRPLPLTGLPSLP
ncbi:hypothetical protein [Streptomyces luteireticuli]|uniref:hypothetical protein n=1 Tax=Streptomyces luteireticuli TaxID=173858 RepID=UPI003556A823